MSKYVKSLITNSLQQRLEGVDELLVVDVIGIDANQNMRLRRDLREKSIHLMVVKNSIARRATEGTALGGAFQGLEGSAAIIWGGEDIVSLAKEVARIAEDKEFAPFAARGGIMDGAPLTADEVKEVSKWPSRGEQLSILSGQILSPGARLSSQLTAVGGLLASQVKKKSEGEEEPMES